MKNINRKIAGLAVLVQLVPLIALGQTGTPQPRMMGTERAAQMRENMEERREARETTMEERRTQAQERRDQMQQRMEERRAQFQARADERRAELTKKLDERRAQNVERFFSNMVDKFERAITRLSDASGKLSVAIDKAVTEGIDVAAAQAQLVIADEKIQAAAEALEAAKTKYADMTASDDLRASFEDVRTAVHELGQKIREAHRALMDVVPLLRSAKQPESATSTSSTNTQ